MSEANQFWVGKGMPCDPSQIRFSAEKHSPRRLASAQSSK
jgi:hypothetical protein